MHLSPRLFLPLIFMAMVAGLGALYLIGGEDALRPFFAIYLVHYDLPPFADAYGITSAMVCERQGIETYLGNPCHYRPGPGFVYPPIWKLLSLLPMQTSWTTPMVLGFIAAFAAALAFLPPIESRRGRVLAALALVSPATVMAVDYGNNDMLLFAVVVAAIVALGRKGWGERVGYGLMLLAGLMKFFPFAGLGWAGKGSLRKALLVLLALIITFGLQALIAGEQLPLSLASIVTMSAGSYVFGIKSLGIAALEMGLVEPSGALVIRLSFTMILFIIAWRMATRFLTKDLHSAIGEDHWRFLVIGSLLVVAAYLASQNLVYREIFLLLLLPGLDALRKVRGENFGRYAEIGVFTMFLFPLRYHLQNLFEPGTTAKFVVSLSTILLREALWFAFAATLLALVFTHLRSGSAWQELTRRWQARTAA